MVGALKRFQSGGFVNDDDPYGDPDAAEGGGGDQGDPGMFASLSDDGNAPQGAIQGIQDARSTGRSLVGDDPAGALSQADLGLDAAVAQKRAGIQRAFDILSAAGQRGNIPEMAYYAALGQPTRTGSFGESMSNAGMAKVEALSKDRNFDMERARLLADQQERLGNLDVEAAKSHEGFLKDRLTLGTNTLDKAARLEAQIANQQRLYHGAEQARSALADYRKQTLAARAQTEARLAQQTQRDGQLERIADRLRTEDPTLPYADSISKARSISSAAGTSDTPLIKNAKYYVEHGIAPDEKTAVAMLRSSVTDATQFQRLVQAEKGIIQRNNVANFITMPPEEVERQAQANVKARAGSVLTDTKHKPSIPLVMKGAQNLTAPVEQARGPVPAAQLAKPQQTGAKVTSIPKRPAKLPAGSAYSASRRMWKDPAGKYYDESGKPTAPPGGG